jgi:hypothetical protein
LPGTVDVDRFSCDRDTSNPWYSSDTMIYRWVAHRRSSAARYIHVEWDTRCEIPLSRFLHGVWEAEVAAAAYYERGDDDRVWHEGRPRPWMWFTREYTKLPPDWRPYAAGLLPLGLMLFSHDALERLVGSVPAANVFSELRLGTTVRRLGLRVQTFPSETIRCGVSAVERVNRPTVYHPVKS